MSQRIHRDNFPCINPLRERTNVNSRLGIRKIRLVVHVKVLASNGKRVVDGIRATMCTDCCNREGQNTELKLML